MCSVFTYSEAEYGVLSESYFMYSGVPPPLVNKAWISNVEAEEENKVSLAEIAKQIKADNNIIRRKRGRPKKVRTEKIDNVPESPFQFDGWFNKDYDSDHGFSEPDWGEMSESENVVQGNSEPVMADIDIPNSPGGLVIDEKTTVKDKTKVKRKKSDLNIDFIESESGILYPCPDCDRKFKAASTLKYHYRIHSGDLLHCEICARGFTNKYLLKCHQRIHTGDLFTCSICGKGFTTAELLKVHRRGHTGEKPYKCDQCSKSFRSASNLSQHKETHLSERRYLCPQCGASFNQRRCLEGHMVVHGEKNQICSVCGKQWARKSDLVEHMRIHTGDKPFKCQLCEQRFTQASSLKRHALTHQELTPYPCDVCDRSFRSEIHYRRHLSKHYSSNQET